MTKSYSQWQKDIAEFEAAQTTFALSFAKTDVAKSIRDFQSSMDSISAVSNSVFAASENITRYVNDLSQATNLAFLPLFKLQSQLSNSLSQFSTSHLVQAFDEMNAQRIETMNRLSEKTNYHIPPYHSQMSLPPSPQNTTHICIHLHLDPSLFTDEDEE